MRLCPRTILTVEDSSDEIFFMQRAFDRLGYGGRVYFARNGTEAVDYLSGIGNYADRSRYPIPCVVVTDLKMPFMDGFQLLQWLRGKPMFEKLPAYVLTSSQHAEDVAKATRFGASDCFQKPRSGMALETVLKQIEAKWLAGLSGCSGKPPRICEPN